MDLAEPAMLQPSGPADGPGRRPCSNPVRPTVLEFGDDPVSTAVQSDSLCPEQQLSASIDAFTQEQRLTNSILREVAVALGAKAANIDARLATKMQSIARASPCLTGGVIKAAAERLQGRATGNSEERSGWSAQTTAAVPQTPRAADAAPHAAPACNAESAESPTVPPTALRPDSVPSASLRTEQSHDSRPSRLQSSETIALQPMKTWGNRLFRWTESNGGKSKQLMRYDFDSIAAWSAIPFILCSCSIFRLRHSLGCQLLGQVVIIIAVCFSIRIQDMGDVDFEQIREDSEAVIQMTENLKRFVPFFLGLFISLCLSRWWSLRAGHLQGLLSAVGRLSFWLRATLPEHASWIRHRVERECMLGHKLVYLCAQGRQDQENLDELEQQGFLSKSEHRTLARQIKSLPVEAQPQPGLFDFDLASLPFTRAAHLIYRVFLYGNRTKGEYGITIPPPVCVKLLSYCMDAWKCIENIEMTLSSPLPFPYFHLVCLLVHFTTLCECVRAGIILGTSLSFSAQQVVCEVFTTLAGNALYCGMLCLAAVLTDPFGNDVVDFPCEMFQHRLLKTQHFASMLMDDDELDRELETRLSTYAHTQAGHHSLLGTVEDEHDHDDGEDGAGHGDEDGDDGD